MKREFSAMRSAAQELLTAAQASLRLWRDRKAIRAEHAAMFGHAPRPVRPTRPARHVARRRRYA